MTKSGFLKVVSFRNFKFFFQTTFVVLGCFASVWSQNQVAANGSVQKDSEVKTETEKTNQNVAPKSGMTVTFDENSPGLIYIESNGEKIRIDANKKTVAQITAPKEEKTSDPLKKEETSLQKHIP